MMTLSWIIFGAAALPAIMYLLNFLFYRRPRDLPQMPTPAISVLIPARNEERSIGPALEAALASTGVDLEVIVLDDHSEDGTAAIVERFAERDSRVKLRHSPPLPAGWCGKQHACFQLSQHASKPLLVFVDADVRLAPDGLRRLAAFQHRTQAGLVSGIPRQETGSLLERLVLPLIHFLLLGFLPMIGMKISRMAGFGAGCGQLFLTTREAYDTVGGHVAVRMSLHDGITLPRAYRKAGIMTDICDATPLATCRMYRNAKELWFGLAKNAREGLAAPKQIGFWTVLLTIGQIVPWLLLPIAALLGSDFEVIRNLALAAGFGLAIRLQAAYRFQQSWLGALLHPLGVACLLAIQWFATIRAWRGNPVGWKGRPNPSVETMNSVSHS
ncbi:glycosyltransferase [Tuwongella immobilis]|uniref:Glycosyltransferase 2-like domain-containing protein n=1 Tax=Tuwongella immobilis TaxID=692036 RepID=A0A6C2YQR7_9BACT|nr:glycosyltransferase [Tuwongella immobilis]VIP03826.1 Uncharacterized protein OS=Candidatus Entotheonella sp. TSY1 GN=ETSY1_19755 PE=4 SV=1: Glycos_transf_2 [Tuwongella immobilis]VTS05019.1 Uncharacterized protein OS=Candidatus Entotheonella sp. TSY1 GN=ETSY1_19755 PE=4 SV=1: Glycos_transf_2 [Tuwongella immobilis]